MHYRIIVRRVAVVLGVLMLASRGAEASTCVASADAFNALMDTQLVSANTVTLSFTVTGVALGDYMNGKGWLAELADTRCAGGATASLKVYGASSPLNTSHPPGTLKLEYGSSCCAQQPCPVEYWADPMPGDPVFSQPSQVCAVTESLTPKTIGYDVRCDGGMLYHAEGANHDAMKITRAAVLREVAGGHAMTNASASNVKICYDLDPPPGGFQTVPVMEDVTVAPQWPASVYPDPGDLACGVGDGTTYLKFDLTALGGKVTSAKLFVHSATDPSATGSGADIDVVADTSWSESTLAWNARPALGARVARIDGVTPDRWYSVDVSGALSQPGKYAFALAPATGDTDTAHFLSKEASATLRAYLLVETVAAGEDAGVRDAGAADGSRPPLNLPPAVQWPEEPSGCSVGPSAHGAGAMFLLGLALAARRLAIRRARARGER